MKRNINNKISNDYRLVKFLFRSSQYLYILSMFHQNSVQQKSTQIILPAMIVTFEQNRSDYNEELQQHIKIFRNKLMTYNQIQKHLIIPKNARKQVYNGKKISLCMIQQKIIPLASVIKTRAAQQEQAYQKGIEKTAPFLDLRVCNSLQQKKQQKEGLPKLQKQIKIMAILQDVMRALYTLHSNGIIHGRIATNTIYGQIEEITGCVKFHLNLLDCITCFSKNQKFDPQECVFRSEGQCFGIPLSEKQDIESLIYVITHLCSQQKLFSLEYRKKQIQKDGPMMGKWKTCFFYKAMISTLPKRLLFVADLYLYLKTLDINDKPNYSFWLKKIEAQHRNFARLLFYNQQSSTTVKNRQTQHIEQLIEQQMQQESLWYKMKNMNNRDAYDDEGNVSDQQQIKENLYLSAKIENLQRVQNSNTIRLISSKF